MSSDRSGSDHELVSFATFVDYRNRRMGAGGVPGAPVQGDATTTPSSGPTPESRAVDEQAGASSAKSDRGPQLTITAIESRLRLEPASRIPVC